MDRYKLAIFVSHPIQYQVPLFRRLARCPDIDLVVYFCLDFGVRKEQYDPGFDKKIKWDIPMLEGYKYLFLTNYSQVPSSKFFGQINPSIINELYKKRYDAILIHGYASVSNWFAFIGAWLTQTPILLRGESHLLESRPFWIRTIKRIYLYSLFKGISAFLPIGSLNKEFYMHYGVDSGKMFLTPYAVDNEFFLENYHNLYLKKQQLKNKLGIENHTPVILYVSKMISRKRPMDLLKAFKQVQARKKVSLVFVGDGIERSKLETYIKENNLNNICFTGFKNQTELPEYYLIADVFVLPSINEPWGLVINEAMNYGLPIITTDKVGAAPDLVRDGENGFIYTAGNISELADCLLKIIQNDELRKKMGNMSIDIISRWSFKEDINQIKAALKYTVNAKCLEM